MAATRRGDERGSKRGQENKKKNQHQHHTNTVEYDGIKENRRSIHTFDQNEENARGFFMRTKNVCVKRVSSNVHNSINKNVYNTDTNNVEMNERKNEWSDGRTNKRTVGWICLLFLLILN